MVGKADPGAQPFIFLAIGAPKNPGAPENIVIDLGASFMGTPHSSVQYWP